MDKRTDTLATLVALNTRRITAIERSLELLVRHVGTDALADELDVLARMDREDAAGSLYWRLARLARRQR